MFIDLQANDRSSWSNGKSKSDKTIYLFRLKFKMKRIYLQDTEGESILICANNNAKVGQELIKATLKPITSCLSSDNHVRF